MAEPWRKELAAQREHWVTSEAAQEAVWAAMLDATSTLKLADHVIKTVSRETLRCIVSEWITQQDFADAMNGVESAESE
jgi:hypothetical protein